MKSWNSAVLLLVLSPAALASDLRSDLRQYASTQVHVLTQEAHVYHYAPREHVVGQDTSPIGPFDSRVRSYAAYLKKVFWDPSNPGTGMAAGNGFYVAIDPVATFSYGGGGTSWVMIQTVMPKGTRYLDVSSWQALDANLTSELTAAGCNAYNLVSIFTSAAVPACRAIRDQLVRDLDLMAIEYSYSAMPFPGICKNSRTQAAFVIFDDRAMGWNRMIAMTSDLPTGNDPQHENRLLIQSLFATSGYSGAQLPWPALDGQSPQSDAGKWAEQNLLDCE